MSLLSSRSTGDNVTLAQKRKRQGRALLCCLPAALLGPPIRLAARSWHPAVGCLAAGGAVLAASSLLSAPLHCEATLPHEGIPGTNQERTFLAVKPDGVQVG